MTLTTTRLSERLLDDFIIWLRGQDYTVIKKDNGGGGQHKLTFQKPSSGRCYGKVYQRDRHRQLEVEGPAADEVERFLNSKFSRTPQIFNTTEQGEREFDEMRLGIIQPTNSPHLYLAVTLPHDCLRLFFPDMKIEPPIKMTITGHIQRRLEIKLDPFGKSMSPYNTKEGIAGRLVYPLTELGGAKREVQGYNVPQSNCWRFHPESKTLEIYNIPEPIMRAATELPPPIVLPTPPVSQWADLPEIAELAAATAPAQAPVVQAVAAAAAAPQTNGHINGHSNGHSNGHATLQVISGAEGLKAWNDLVEAIAMVNEAKSKLPGVDLRIDEGGILRARASLEA